MRKFSMRGLRASFVLWVCVWLGWAGCGAYADAPVITAMTPRGSWTTELTVTNCSDTNFNQVIQLSTNLQDWTTISTSGTKGKVRASRRSLGTG